MRIAVVVCSKLAHGAVIGAVISPVCPPVKPTAARLEKPRNRTFDADQALLGFWHFDQVIRCSLVSQASKTRTARVPFTE